MSSGMIGSSCRAGGGGHAGSHSASGFGSSGHVVGGGGGGYGGPGIIGVMVILFILWLVFRRVRRDVSGGQTFAASSMAREAVSTVLGTAVGLGVGARPSAVTATPMRPGLPLAMETIRSGDPAFEIESFLQRAEMTFFLVKRGIQKNDAAGIRPYLSDDVFAVVSRNIGQMATRHQHALMESLNVRDVHLIDAACAGDSQSLVVHFDLVYRAKTLDDANRVLADEGEDRRHGERWTFRRASSAKTPADGGVIASRCPNCGAELRLGLDGTCAHCRASVTNGTVDWVVVDVQPAPFMGFTTDAMLGIVAPTVADGIAGLRAADPNFSIDAFLVRVNTGFMALQDAWCRQDLDAGRTFLSPGAYFSWRAQLETMAEEGRRNVMEGLVVHRIEPRRVVHGRVFDDLTVRVFAAAADYEVNQSGQIVFGNRSVQPFAEEWTFQRSVGVASSGKAGTLEKTCPNCGAPLVLTQIGECRYCKAAVTSGKFDWVVSRIEQEDSFDGPSAGNGNDGSEVTSLIGGAIVGGLLGSLLSGD